MTFLSLLHQAERSEILLAQIYEILAARLVGHRELYIEATRRAVECTESASTLRDLGRKLLRNSLADGNPKDLGVGYSEILAELEVLRLQVKGVTAAEGVAWVGRLAAIEGNLSRGHARWLESQLAGRRREALLRSASGPFLT